jgi:HupE / UreJ protein
MKTKTRLAGAVAILLSLGARVSAHRLDEYLQAALFTLEKARVEVSLRLVPGVAVFSQVVAEIDTDGDAMISESEKRAYTARVLGDLSLSIDGHPLRPRLVSVSFPGIEAMKQGLGEIQIEIAADLPPGGQERRLVFENRHASPIAAYLANCLVPRDPDIQVTGQKRNEQQSFYELDYTQGDARANTAPAARPGMPGWLSAAAGTFHLGMRHIAEGTDHLLFLLALLLPAPLIVRASRWGGFGGLRHSLLQILRVVTAFTLGHSITLALAALSVVQVPSRPIEVLIAVSILVSAIHALRPVFPGREAAIAAFFGLVHGLAFATTLGQLGLEGWDRVTGLLGFNLGIETMQLIVVAATMPSLILLSRTRAYGPLRIGGALFATLAAAGWVIERLLNARSAIDPLLESIARHGPWIAGALFLISLPGWLLRTFPAPPRYASYTSGEAYQRDRYRPGFRLQRRIREFRRPDRLVKLKGTQ